MKKNISQSCLLFFLTVFSFQLQAQDIIPLDLGNYWIYKEETYRSDSLVSIDTTLNSVTKRIKINNKSFYVLNEFGSEFFVRNTKEGQVEVDTFNIDSTGKYLETLFWKNPQNGEDISYVAYEENHIHIDKDHIIYSTVIGDFKCYKYTLTIEEQDENDFKVITFFSPGIGLVYEDCIFDGKHILSELIEYHVK